MQNKKAVNAYLESEQLLSFAVHSSVGGVLYTAVSTAYLQCPLMAGMPCPATDAA